MAAKLAILRNSSALEVLPLCPRIDESDGVKLVKRTSVARSAEPKVWRAWSMWMHVMMEHAFHCPSVRESTASKAQTKGTALAPLVSAPSDEDWQETVRTKKSSSGSTASPSATLKVERRPSRFGAKTQTLNHACCTKPSSAYTFSNVWSI